MSQLLIGLLGALLATNPPAAVSNLVQQQTGLSVRVPDKNDPLEKAFQKLLAEDDAAHEQIDQWIKDNQNFQAKGAGLDSVTLNARIEQRREQVRKAYESFLLQHPDHARARLAYGSFLSDLGDEEAALPQLEKARQLDPKNAAAWNNLANYYGHNGPTAKAFEYYTKAIELNPGESVYYRNFATTVYMFRGDATNYFKIGEREVFEKAMALYRKALALDPENFLLATDYAMSYYGFQPRKTGETEADRRALRAHFEGGLAAWQSAFKLARDDIERQGVLIHFARFHINLGQFDAARTNLAGVSNEMFTVTRERVMKNLAAKENQAKGTNAPASSAPPAAGAGAKG